MSKLGFLAVVCAAVVGNSALVQPAGAQPIYRCGTTYSQSPCPGSPASAPIRIVPTEGLSPTGEMQRPFVDLKGGATGEKLCRMAIQDKLKDPESAQFTDVDTLKGGRAYSGFVNARNSYGGYVGKKLFSCKMSDDGAAVLSSHTF